MKPAISFVLVCLVVFVGLLIHRSGVDASHWLVRCGDFYLCAIVGGIGGCVYCLRGIYRTKCVLNNWDDRWLTWYILRPIVSLLTGAVACLFLKAGLLLLESKQSAESSGLAMYAIAFIAGYNVDNFMKRLEESIRSLCGVDPTRGGVDKP